MLASTDSSKDTKTSILLLGQGHSDPFPIETAKEIYKYCTNEGINVIVGFETSDLLSFTDNDKFLDLREKFLDSKATKQEKDQYLKELIEIEPLKTFHESVGKRKAGGLPFDDKLYHRLLTNGEASLDCVSKKKVYATLEDLIKFASLSNCFPIESPDLDNEVDKSCGLAGVDGDETQILETYEHKRTDFMRDVILDKARELEGSGDKKNSLILIVNLGALHAQRLHAKLDIACQSKPNIKSFHIAIVDAKKNPGEFQHLEIEEPKEIQEFYEKNPLLIVKTDSLQTDPALFDKVIVSCLDHMGIDGRKMRLKTADEPGPLLPPNSTISDGKSVVRRDSSSRRP